MIRGNIYGFSIAEFKSYEGSKNQEVLNKVLARLYDGDDLDVDEYVEARKIAKLFFSDGAEKADFDNETYDHYYFIRALIHVQNGLIYTDFECSDKYLFEYFNKLQEKLTGVPKQLINFFIEGRSIFSDKAGLSPAYYPYVILKLSEIKILSHNMENNIQLYKDSEGVFDLFSEALKNLVDQDADLYFNAS